MRDREAAGGRRESPALSPPGPFLTVVVPALNEEGSIRDVVAGILAGLAKRGIDADLIVVDDGSADRTGEIADGCARGDRRVRVIHHPAPRGVGSSFLDGAREARGSYVTWLPGDGENDPEEMLKYVCLLGGVDIVIPFVVNTGVRSAMRRAVSALFCSLVNFSFRTRFNYTNGTSIFRTDLLRGLRVRNTGFLCFAEILVKLVKGGALYAEVPVMLPAQMRKSGASKAFRVRTLWNLFAGFVVLLYDVYLRRPRAPVGRDGRGQRADNR